MKKRKLVIYNNKVAKIISHDEDKIIIKYYDENLNSVINHHIGVETKDYKKIIATNNPFIDLFN